MGQVLEGESKLDVISIVGMAGVGKTTLALTLCSRPSVVRHFDRLACCTVSQSFQPRALFLSILDQADPYNKSHTIPDDKVDDAPDKSDTSKSKKQLSEMGDQDLFDHLCRRLKRRRYLIVLDDIWDTKVWNDLKVYLPNDNNGSRILITTRISDVANQIGSKVNKLHELSERNSWELFQKKMQLKENLPLSYQLNKIARRIVKLCKGLPLSIVIIAGILFDIKRTEKKWNKIADSVSSRVLSDTQGNCKAILELSYSHLEDHLGLCFLYLASFPEDQEISVNQLINRWIGEGFVRDTDSESAEEVATNYIKNLIAKSLVVPAKEKLGGGVKTIRLHDLLRDFCLSKATDKHFFTMLVEM